MSVVGIASQIFSSQQAVILVLLVLGNLLAGVAAALHQGTFDLTRLSEWTVEHLLSVLLGYGAAAFLAVADPQLGYVRDAAFATISLTFVGFILSNLQDLGIIQQVKPQSSTGGDSPASK